MEEFDFILKDRLAIIKDFISNHGVENLYIGYSGGKDSTVLSYLVDMSVPSNNIPRVYVDTGIAYKLQNDFVKELCRTDKRFVYISPAVSIKPILDKYGYPFKSKIHSRFVDWFNQGIRMDFVDKYINEEYYSYTYRCLPIFKHQFAKQGKYNFSAKCCVLFKEMPLEAWSIANHRRIYLTGMRRSEGGNRKDLPCITKAYGEVRSFNPLAPLSNEFMDWFIQKYNVKLCPLYYEPYNYHRTGCKGCPFNYDLQTDLLMLQKYQPAEFKHCLMLWEYPYKEYIRTGYRLTIDFYKEK